MPDLSTTYMGLKLRNPIIVGSSTHTISPAGVKALENAGAGAVVLKSIFEEQVRVDVADMYDDLENDMHAEALDYLRADLPMRVGPQVYLDRIRRIKEAVGIPVIASINCVTPAKWVTFAREIQAAGADGLELNVYDIPDDESVPGQAVEQRHLDLVKAVMGELDVPVAVKIGCFYSSLMNFTHRLSQLGVGAIVMFNRFFQPDVDVETLELKTDINLSRPEDIRLPLRWTAIVRDQVDCDLSLTTGVHDAEGAIKAILAGANTVQVCSVLYRKGGEQIGTILSGMGEWMERKGYAKLDDFRGLLREKNLSDNRGFERAQYLKAFVGLE